MQAVDKDHSGFISLTEYKLFFKCLGLTPENAAVSFAVIDKNGDGKLTIKEFVKLGREFFLTEDERKVSRMFWGPLVDHWSVRIIALLFCEQALFSLKNKLFSIQLLDT